MIALPTIWEIGLTKSSEAHGQRGRLHNKNRTSMGPKKTNPSCPTDMTRLIPREKNLTIYITEENKQ